MRKLGVTVTDRTLITALLACITDKFANLRSVIPILSMAATTCRRQPQLQGEEPNSWLSAQECLRLWQQLRQPRSFGSGNGYYMATGGRSLDRPCSGLAGPVATACRRGRRAMASTDRAHSALAPLDGSSSSNWWPWDPWAATCAGVHLLCAGSTPSASTTPRPGSVPGSNGASRVPDSIGVPARTGAGSARALCSPYGSYYLRTGAMG